MDVLGSRARFAFTFVCLPRGEVPVFDALFIVPLLETGIGIGIGEVVLGGRRWDDKGDELAEFW